MAAQLWSLCAETAETPPELFPAPRIFITAAGQPKMHYPATACKPPFAMLSSGLIATLCSVLSACGGGNASADLEKTVAAELPSMATSASAADTPSSAPDASLLDASKAEPLVAQMPTQSASDAVGANSKIAAATKTSTVAPSSALTPAVKAATPAAIVVTSAQARPTTTPISAIAPAPSPVQAPVPVPDVQPDAKIASLVSAATPAPTPVTAAKSASTVKAQPSSLASPSPSAVTTIGATSSCNLGYMPNPGLASTQALPLPTDGGATFSIADLAAWRAYTSAIDAGRFSPNSATSPGSVMDWKRIKANAAKFLASGDPIPSDTRLYAGINVRDAAFYFLMSSDAVYLSKLTAYMVKTLEDPANDFASTLCYRSLDPKAPMLDANFGEAAWFMRLVLAYDYIRASIKNADDRKRIENALRRQAYFFAGQIDSGLALSFPNRLSGDYKTVRKGYAAAATNDAEKWLTSRYDTDGNCSVDSKDNPAQFPVYAYFDKASGKFGPRISILSQWYNNRKSLSVLGWGLAGLVLSDSMLIDHAKRYFMEWLTYAVYPDGSEGEYARNGDYCIPRQGTIYGYTNIQAAQYVASWLKKNGDPSLINFQTTDGLYGTESASPAGAKSIAKVAETYAKLEAGELSWYFAEPWKSTQQPVAKNAMGALEVRFNNGGATDEYHELGLLLSSEALPVDKRDYIRSIIMRVNAPATTSRFPGSTGNPVATGLNNGWSDASNLMPAIFLLDRGPSKR